MNDTNNAHEGQKERYRTIRVIVFILRSVPREPIEAANVILFLLETKLCNVISETKLCNELSIFYFMLV